jgi:hypothetical protein
MNYGWVGAVTPTGFTVSAQVTGPVDTRLAVSQFANMSDLVYTDLVVGADGWHKHTITGLDPSTEYYWAIEEGGVLNAAEGPIRTFPVEGEPASFTLAGGSCCSTNTDPITFSRVRARAPDFFLHMGDFHYNDISTNNESLFLSAFETQLGQTNQGALFREVPIAYMWDDHDYGPNNSDSTAAGRPAALTAYRKAVPHYPIPFAGPDNDTPISQTFVVGRVRFVILDLRSEALHSSNYILGTEQLNWLLNIIETFTEAMLVINVSVPWIISAAEQSDAWGVASSERTAVSNAIQEYAKGKVLLVHGDSHMVAMDDGTNTNYATVPDGPGPRLCCFAPLNRSNSVKGGPYTEGTYANSNTQYGTLEFVDTGTSITVTANGYDAATDNLLVSMTWEVVTPSTDQIVYWADTLAEADAFPAGAAVYVKSDGPNPTRLRLNGDWWDIDAVTQDGVQFVLSSVEEGAGGELVSLSAGPAVIAATGIVTNSGARYVTGYSEYPSSAQPADWTKRGVGDTTWQVVDDAGAMSGKLLRATKGTGSGQEYLTWDTVDADDYTTNIEIAAKMRYTGSLASSDMTVVARGSGTVGNYSFVLGGFRGSNSTFRLSYSLNGSFTDLGSVPVSLTQGQWYWVRLRCAGDVLRAKWWADGEEEPVNWTFNVTNTAVQGPGGRGSLVSVITPLSMISLGWARIILKPPLLMLSGMTFHCPPTEPL